MNSNENGIQDYPEKGGSNSLVSLRVWPVVPFLIGMVVLRYLPQWIENGTANTWMATAYGPAVCSLLILVWWITASRASQREKWVGFFGVLGIVFTALVFADRSMRGPATTILIIPSALATFAISMVIQRKRMTTARTKVALSMTALILCGSLCIRYTGMYGDLSLSYRWRFAASHEDVMLQQKQNDLQSRERHLLTTLETETEINQSQWTGFRGSKRSGVCADVRVHTDWESSPPKQLWKIDVGPGWSSFAVAGNRLFTQEQRGAKECVVCYDSESGMELWEQSVPTRFSESLSGVGPRATPTIAGNKLYALGANGHLLCLDAKTGSIVWQQFLQEIAQRKPPEWGFCSSPLVYQDLVVVHAGGQNDKGLPAFDVESGGLQWSASSGDHSYSSPHIDVIAGKPCLFMLTNTGLDIVEPKTGRIKLSYAWPYDTYRATQPHVINGDSVLIPSGMGVGTRCVRVSSDGEQLIAKEQWTSQHLKPDFNDFVVHDGYAYGFDNTIFTCIDLKTGDRAWKRGRYGQGQVLLLKETGTLLVTGERGGIYLLNANPEKHEEIAAFEAIDGKSWNHPVVVNDRLYVRNSRFAACYLLPTSEHSLVATMQDETLR